MVVGGQVSVIHVRLRGAQDIAKVVKAVPCGLLHKRERRGMSGQEGVGIWDGVGYPRPHLLPHSFPAKEGNICLLYPLGWLELPVAHAA